MLDEKLNILIHKYGIYDSIGGIVDFSEAKSPKNHLQKSLRRLEGEIRLIYALNAALNTVEDDAVVAWWGEGKIREKIRFWMLSPKNRRKIQFLIYDRREDIKENYVGLTAITSGEIENVEPKIQAIILMYWDSGRYANLIGRKFLGKIFDIPSLICENKLIRFFSDKLKQNPYADIFIARHCLNVAKEDAEKQKWHKMLIAYYLKIRDFLNVKREIQKYVKNEYEDSIEYFSFWDELEKLLFNIKSRLANRRQRDVFIFWLDSMEKEEFYSMPWLGKVEGKVFHRAYTTMNYTTLVCKSIFYGENVKKAKLQDKNRINLEESAFNNYLERGREIHIFSNNFFSKFGAGVVHEGCRPFPMNLPLTVSMWYAMDTLLSTSNACVNLLHCMETHSNFQCGEIPWWPLDIRYRDLLALNQSINFKKLLETSADYIDQQLEWYNKFLSPNTISIFMSDHGMESDLSEENINMPFKIIGNGVISSTENRLFSYKDLHRLISAYMMFPMEENLDACFTSHAIIDGVDPYDKGFAVECRDAIWNKYILERKILNREFLKKYLQTTKVVTAEGEHYTINILGEETYYRDEDCKINLINDPAYAKRIAELREEAGEFYNPWKEKRQVAIDFYKYLGIKEEDIVAQCF